jgi:hypothetical protein
MWPMTEQALPRPSRLPWLLPAILFVVLMAALAAIVLLARDAGKSEAPPKLDAFVPPAPMPYRAYDVERAVDGKLTLTSGAGQNTQSSDIQLTPDVRVWLLEPVQASALKAPLVANVITIPNEVRNYTIKMLAFAPVPADANFTGDFIPLADGFAGYETSRDAKERVSASVIMESFDGRNGVTRTSTGPGTLYVDEGASVRLLRRGTPADIEPGDRLAFHTDADGNPDPSRGVLVLTGGAR